MHIDNKLSHNPTPFKSNKKNNKISFKGIENKKLETFYQLFV